MTAKRNQRQMTYRSGNQQPSGDIGSRRSFSTPLSCILFFPPSCFILLLTLAAICTPCASPRFNIRYPRKIILEKLLVAPFNIDAWVEDKTVAIKSLFFLRLYLYEPLPSLLRVCWLGPYHFLSHGFLGDYSCLSSCIFARKTPRFVCD